MPAITATLQNELAGADFDIRPARKDDAEHLAKLINYAGEGLPLYFWEQLAEDGQDAWAVGRERARRDQGAFSWRNAVVCDVAGEVAAVLVTYGIGDTPEEIDPENMPAAFVPLVELENMALGTEYVNVLAAYPAFRGNGIGTRLLQEADRRAGERDLSIIVSNGNTGAMRLYQRHGFRRKASRPIATLPGWSCDGSDWVLMIKEAG